MNEHLVVTIGRQYGSGGREIGKTLAERLGLAYYDKELIVEAAKASGLDQKFLETSDEKAPNIFLYSMAFSSPSPATSGIYIYNELFDIQSKVVRSVAEKSPCVIIGRCADYLLKERPNCLRVFIHGSLENRMDRVAQRQNICLSEARDLILKTDKKRSNYYRSFTGQKWNDMEHYDLVIDSSFFGIEQTISLLTDAIHDKFGK